MPCHGMDLEGVVKGLIAIGFNVSVGDDMHEDDIDREHGTWALELSHPRTNGNTLIPRQILNDHAERKDKIIHVINYFMSNHDIA